MTAWDQMLHISFFFKEENDTLFLYSGVCCHDGAYFAFTVELRHERREASCPVSVARVISKATFHRPVSSCEISYAGLKNMDLINYSHCSCWCCRTPLGACPSASSPPLRSCTTRQTRSSRAGSPPPVNTVRTRAVDQTGQAFLHAVPANVITRDAPIQTISLILCLFTCTCKNQCDTHMV